MASTEYLSHFVHPDTRIVTETGVKPICGIRKTDHVLTSKGSFVPMAEIYEQKYKGKLLSINGGTEIVHEDHEMMVFDGKVGETFMMPARDLVAHDLSLKLVRQLRPGHMDIHQLDIGACKMLGLIYRFGKTRCTPKSTAGTQYKVDVELPQRCADIVEGFRRANLEYVGMEKDTIVVVDPFHPRFICEVDAHDRSILHKRIDPCVSALPIEKLDAICDAILFGEDIHRGMIEVEAESASMARSMGDLFVAAGWKARVDGKTVRLGRRHDNNTNSLVGRALVDIDGIEEVDYEGSLYDVLLYSTNDEEATYCSSTAVHHNGGGKRNGSFAIYLEPWHADILDFLELKKPQGHEEHRARDLFYALWVPDLFMEKVKKDDEWHLMDPNISKGLSDVHSGEFDELYEKYVSEGSFVRVLKARELWMHILVSQIETGTPYFLFKDTANRTSNQQNLGTIKSSNLCSEIILYTSPEEAAVCLTGDTEIMTDDGLKRLDMIGTERIRHEFHEDATGAVTRNASSLPANLVDNGVRDVFEIEMGGTKPVRATGNHRFLVHTHRNYDTEHNGYEWKKTDELRAGDRIISPNCDTLERYSTVDSTALDDEYLTAGWLIGDGWQLKKNDVTIHGAPSRKIEQGAVNEVTPIIDRWHRQAAVVEGGQDYACSLYTAKVGGMQWSSRRGGVLQHIGDRFGLMPHKQPRKVIPERIKYEFEPAQQAAVLSGYFSADGTVSGDGEKQYVSLASSSQYVLFDVQAMLRCFGIQSKVGHYGVKSRNRNEDKLRIYGKMNLTRFRRYINFGLCKEKRDRLEYIIGTDPTRLKRTITQIEREWSPIKAVRPAGRHQVYDLSMQDAHTFLAGGVVSHNCNLSSVSLPAFVDREDVSFKFDELHAIVKIMTRNLNRVIDVNYYPIEEARTSNMSHRPIGIGMQGLADVFCILKYPFESEDAMKLNRDISETMYHAALEASCELAAERETDIREYKQLAAIGDKTKEIKKQINHILKQTEFSKEELTRQYCAGSYDSYLLNGGCPLSMGKFKFDLHNVKPSDRYDWTVLREAIDQHGVRNSELIALMPTASTAQILGNSESMEAYHSNIFNRRTMAGEFMVVNKFLMADLLEMGLWDEVMKQRIMAANGSIQRIDEIPPGLRDVYKTVWEIKQRNIMKMAADRQPFVCQSQSMNIHLIEPTKDVLSSMHMYAWKQDLITSTYYLRCMPRAAAQKFTVDPKYQKKYIPATSVSPREPDVEAPYIESSPVCTRENKECEMCSG